MQDEGIAVPENADLTMLREEEEIALIKQISLLPEEIVQAAADRDPSRMNKYAVAMCAQFHRFYNACRIKEAEPAVRDARLVLCAAARQTIYNVLTIIGVDAPEHM
jgi:arginyl-tRNA synthetase